MKSFFEYFGVGFPKDDHTWSNDEWEEANRIHDKTFKLLIGLIFLFAFISVFNSLFRIL